MMPHNGFLHTLIRCTVPSRKKKSAAASGADGEAATDAQPAANGIAKGAKPGQPLVQTNPPTVAIKDLFPSGDFPEGEEVEYKQE